MVADVHFAFDAKHNDEFPMCLFAGSKRRNTVGDPPVLAYRQQK